MKKWKVGDTVTLRITEVGGNRIFTAEGYGHMMFIFRGPPLKPPTRKEWERQRKIVERSFRPKKPKRRRPSM